VIFAKLIKLVYSMNFESSFRETFLRRILFNKYLQINTFPKKDFAKRF